jgi:DNA-directed RNA polymerase specialized sigma subunit
VTITANLGHTGNLPVNEQYALITDIQNVPTTVTVQEDGSEYVVYGVTPASEAAGEKLLAAFMPAIKAAARRTKLRGNEDEAEAVALEAFVRAVREYDLTSDTPFHHIIRNVLRNAISVSDTQESTAVTIPEGQVDRYHRQMHAHGNDVRAAYAAATAARNDDGSRVLLSKEAFLTIHLALHGTSSLDVAHPETSELASPADAALTVADSVEDGVIRREYVRWLLDQPTERQAQICRLAYGFTDIQTGNACVLKGYRSGDVLEDLQVADVLDMARSTVNRERGKALATMRAAAEKSLENE